MSVPPDPIRVFFIHGLESSPNGSKVQLLRAQGFTVVAPDLQMGLMKPGRTNSAVRMVLRLPEPWVVLGAVALIAFVGHPWVALAIAAIAVLVRRRAVAAQALARSFDACVAVARAALTDARPDVVVGSSWGGAVATQLGWTGPLILLAPAVAKVAAWSRTPIAVPPELSAVVFHDPTDATVPFADSETLARTHAGVALRKVDAGGHRLMGLLETGMLAAEIRRLCG